MGAVSPPYSQRFVEEGDLAPTLTVKFGRDDVVDRSKEIATQLQDSGAVERVAGAADQYDEYFAQQDDTGFGPHTFGNRGQSPPANVGDRIRMHAREWSD